MSSPVGYPQRGAYPMFSSTSQGDVPVGKNGTNLIPVMANVIPSSGEIGSISAGDVSLLQFSAQSGLSMPTLQSITPLHGRPLRLIAQCS